MFDLRFLHAPSRVHQALWTPSAWILPVFVGLAACLALFAGPAANAAGQGSDERFAAIVIDAQTGETLYARHADARRYPASITKVMTLYLAFDALDAGRAKPTDRVIISPRAASRPPSRLGLAAGSSLSLQEAMDVLVVKSANDLATALAERLGGNEAAFARAMTAKARSLGLSHTQFRNASGLPDPGHYSTARDLALLGRAFLRDHPDDYAIFNQEQTVFRGRVIRGHNRLLAKPGIDGFKTGFVNASGYNLLTSGRQDGRRVIAVVLGGRSARSRDAFMERLVQASFSSLAIRSAGFEVAVNDLLNPTQPARQVDDKAIPPAAAPTLMASTTTEPEIALAQGDVASPSAERARWWVQVGAFRSKASSAARLADVTKRHPRRFGARARDVSRIGALFAARFSARSAEGASAACEVLTAEGEDCLVLME
jgi:D-alanyl-D-alanine carboxypeptidase (penicillin-binding protein 5/6)